MADTPSFTPLILSTLKADNAVVDPVTGKPTSSFLQNINNSFKNILATVNNIGATEAEIKAIQDEQTNILTQLVAINGFIVDANGQLISLAISGSYTNPQLVLTASTSGTTTLTSSIVIADHQRVYTDGVTVSVTGGTLTGLDPNTLYFIYYSDPTRQGGTVTYHASVNQTDAAQVNGIHNVGSITTPATSGGSGTPGGGGGGGTVPSCVDEDSYMPYDLQAKDVKTWSDLAMLNADQEGFHVSPCEAIRFSIEKCARIETMSGITLVCSLTTPITTRGDKVLDIRDCVGFEVPVLDQGDFRWEKVVAITYLDEPRRVACISAHDGTYAAGEHDDGRYIFTHNISQAKQ